MTAPDWDARRATCGKCSGSGRFVGVKRGRRHDFGPCFQCGGKGWVSRRDDARTAAYWLHRAAAEMASDERGAD